MTYFVAATMASVPFIFVRWWSRQNYVHAAASGLPMKSMDWQRSSISNQSATEVSASLTLALKRLMPLMTSRGVRTDVAVHPGLLVHISEAALADLLEDLLAAAIHQAQTSRLLLTAVGHGRQTYISVTDDAPVVDPAERTRSVRGLAEGTAQRGGVLKVEVRSAAGTTMTLHLTSPRRLTIPVLRPGLQRGERCCRDQHIGRSNPNPSELI